MNVLYWDGYLGSVSHSAGSTAVQWERDLLRMLAFIKAARSVGSNSEDSYYAKWPLVEH